MPSETNSKATATTKIILVVEETPASVVGEGANFCEASLDLLRKVKNDYGDIHPEIFAGLYKLATGEEEELTYTDFSTPEDTFTLTLKN